MSKPMYYVQQKGLSERSAKVAGRSAQDSRDCLEIGEAAEQLFARIAEERGWEVILAPRECDIRDHWDYVIVLDDDVYFVDVKSRKRRTRADNEFDDDWVWIELKGKKDAGWLYGGESTHLAFETPDSFVLVERERLGRLVKRLVKWNTISLSPDCARYAVYYRQGFGPHSDQLTQIELSEIRKIQLHEWYKTSR